MSLTSVSLLIEMSESSLTKTQSTGLFPKPLKNVESLQLDLFIPLSPAKTSGFDVRHKTTSLFSNAILSFSPDF